MRGIEKGLPHNSEAERAVLGALIIDPDAIVLIADRLQPGDFYLEAHRLIYEALLLLFSRHEPADYITLCDLLARQKHLDTLGDATYTDLRGASYVSCLTNETPTSGNVAYYAGLVIEKSMRRQGISVAMQLAQWGYDEDQDAEEMILRGEELLHRVGQRNGTSGPVALVEHVSAYMTHLDRICQQREQGIISGVPTGFSNLDRMTGGLQRSDLIVLAGRPGKGKTSLAMNIAQNVATSALGQGFNVLVFSLEMSGHQLTQRLLAAESGIDQMRLRGGYVDTKSDEWDLLAAAAGRLADARLWVDDTPAISTTEVRSKARRMQAEHGLDLVIVDYLQLMKASVQSGRHENRVQEVSEISRSLKALARELNVPVLALAQLSRAVESRADKVPQLSDLRESGSIEQDSDIVMFIYDEAEIEGNAFLPVDIIFAKHRNGPVGPTRLLFDQRLTQFHEPSLEVPHE